MSAAGEASFVARATRFAMSVPIRYRAAAPVAAWQTGSIENISRSGVLFRASDAVPLETPMELAFELPAATRKKPAHVVCRGRVVRTAPADPSARCGLAVAITHYRFQRGAMPLSS